MNEFKLPELGENITQGTITQVLVKSGDTVSKGQNVLELETDKAVLEVPCNVDGVVGEIAVKSGSTVKVGQTVFTLSGSKTTQTQPLPTRGHVTEGNVSRAPASVRQEDPSTRPSKTAIEGEGTPGKPLSAPPASPVGIFDVLLPALGENIEKGTVTKVLVKVGDTLKKGQNILELETDKAVLEVPSSSQGLIKEILIQTGSVIKVGQPIFKIEGSSSTMQAQPLPTRGHVPEGNVSTSTRPNETTTEGGSAPGQAPSASPGISALPVRKDVPAAPSVRLLARELGLDIALVPGSGPGGRISTADVKAYCKLLNTTRPAGGPAAFSQPALPNFAKWGSVRREAMNNVRKKTADHMSNAWSSIPHVTQFDLADITELEKFRKTVSGTNKKISVTPFLIKTLCGALKKFPQFNASIDMSGHEIIFKDYINIGVAVDTDRGLLVPVLKNADRMSVLQISDELAAMAEKARLRKTTLDELQGGCFTVSNLGGIGGTYFTPIINWPEVAILGVSRNSMQQIYVNGAFEGRMMLPLSLSYDHRIIDGADAARFLRWVCETLQEPAKQDWNS